MRAQSSHLRYQKHFIRGCIDKRMSTNNPTLCDGVIWVVGMSQQSRLAFFAPDFGRAIVSTERRACIAIPYRDFY